MREPIPKALQLAVWYRDSWHCQYCGDAIFFSQTLILLDLMSPGHGYYDQHGKGSKVSLLENRCACCDHVKSVSDGGGSSLENLVAACFSCHRKKSAGEMQRHIVGHLEDRPKGWDGLASIYPFLPAADPKWCRLIEVQQSQSNT